MCNLQSSATVIHLAPNMRGCHVIGRTKERYARYRCYACHKLALSWLLVEWKNIQIQLHILLKISSLVCGKVWSKVCSVKMFDLALGYCHTYYSLMQIRGLFQIFSNVALQFNTLHLLLVLITQLCEFLSSVSRHITWRGGTLARRTCGIASFVERCTMRADSWSLTASHRE